MPSVSELAQREISNFTNTISPYAPEEVLIYINVGGQNVEELEQAFDCIWFDDRRQFNVVDIKKQPHLLSALVVMKPEFIPPVRF